MNNKNLIIDKDLGFNKIMTDALKASNISVAVGFQDGDITHLQVKGDRRKSPGASIAQIAAYNEFGTDVIPERSFMRSGFDENQSRIVNFANKQFGLVIDGALNLNDALGLIGQLVQGIIQVKIRQIRTPPNAPSTIKKKGSDKPLIDFGQMIQSVRYAIVRN